MITWPQAMRGFSQYLALERSMAANTSAAYLRDVHALQTTSVKAGQAPGPSQLTQADVERLLATMATDGIAPATQARTLSGVKAFFDFLIYEDVLATSPAELVVAPRQTRELPDVLSVEEVDAILAVPDLSKPDGLRARAILETLYGSGLRVSELCGLHQSQVYADAGLLRVIGKRDKERLVPASPSSLAFIKQYVDQVRAKLPGLLPDQEGVFLNSRGKPLSRISVFTMVKQIAAAAGIRKTVSPHTFRHCFATHLVEAGADLRAVQELLGHESITTTEIYTHLDMGYLRQTIADFHPRSQKPAIFSFES